MAPIDEMHRTRTFALAVLLALLGVIHGRAAETGSSSVMEQGFGAPCQAAKVWIYWWWLNGCATKDGILRDLDAMQRVGVGGALVFNAGGGKTPFTTEFMSPPWRALFKFAVEEAAKRKIVIGLNVCDGWNAGGTWVKPEEAAQTLAFRQAWTAGPKTANLTLAKPDCAGDYYSDIAVLAWRLRGQTGDKREFCEARSLIDLTGKLRAGGGLTWEVPAGRWVVIRFGRFVGQRAHTKLTGGAPCLEIDPLRAEAMDCHFAATVGVVLQDVKEYAGKTFQYVHIDSGEIGTPDWTPAYREEFKNRRGYDPYPYLAARAKLCVDSPEVTDRFQEDDDRTLGDLMVENYYGRLAVLARRHGLGTHSEAAGFQKPCVDALASMGCNDICMSEFWARCSETGDQYIHQLSDFQLHSHDGIRNAAAAACAYGRRIVQGEAFTVMRRGGFPNWDKDPFALKDLGDRAFCAGLNRQVLCFWILQPDEAAKPGYEWPGVGTEFDRHVTWWPLGHAWLTYLARCQSLLQAGHFVADAAYFEGEWVPNYVPAKWAMNPSLPPGFDCTTVNAQTLTARTRVGKDGCLILNETMSLRYLVLPQGGRWINPGLARLLSEMVPERDRASVASAPAPADKSLVISPAALGSVWELVESGATLIGPSPSRSFGLSNYPASDQEVQRLAAALWGPEPSTAGERKVGKGRVIWGKQLDEIFKADGLAPDLQIEEDAATATLPKSTLSGIPNPSGGSFDWIHRRIDPAEIYFIANLRNAQAAGAFTFRAAGRVEVWDAVTGQIRPLPQFTATQDGRTRVPLCFAPRQSFFIVFRESRDGRRDAQNGVGNENFPALKTTLRIQGAWRVSFDPKWGGPEMATFEKLEDWTRRPEPGIKYYSGRATYRTAFDCAFRVPRSNSPHSAVYLDLGTAKNIARVRLNGRDLGVVWTAPWHVEITDAVKEKGNRLEIDVINLWPNRLIGDASLPLENRLTKTNVPGIKPDMALFPSGLLGPVTIQTE